MPRACKLPVCAQDALDEGRPVVGALGADGLDGPGGIEQEDLGIEALYFNLLLLAWLQRQRADPFKLVFLCHFEWYCREEALGCERRESQGSYSRERWADVAGSGE